MQHVAGDTDDLLDQGLPLGCGQSVSGTEYLGFAGFMAITALGDRGIAAGGAARSAEGFSLLQQSRLVILQLDDCVCTRRCDGLESFFWQCMASSVTVQLAN